jgi:hypothetical protein
MAAKAALMARVFAIRRSEGAVEVFAPYVPEYVGALKESVPYGYRTFNPEQKTWTIYPPYVNAATECVWRYFDAVEWLVPEQGHSSVSLEEIRRRFPDHAVLHLLPDAPVNVIHSAYRALALEHHPDRAGADAHQRMVQLNLAYERLRTGGRRVV